MRHDDRVALEVPVSGGERTEVGEDDQHHGHRIYCFGESSGLESAIASSRLAAALARSASLARGEKGLDQLRRAPRSRATRRGRCRATPGAAHR